MTDRADAGRGATTQPRLTIVPITLREARSFISEHHRHHLAPNGGKFAIGVADEAGDIRGVAIVAQPVARLLADGWTAEVTRVATDGCPNACSALYGACWRAAKGMGYRRLVTYTLKAEPGTSLVAAGWRCVGEAGGGTWDRSKAGRPRVDKHPTQTKMRWEVAS